MMRRIATLLRQDWTNALRDNILLYMMAAPLLLALGARLFLPGLDQSTYTFAVDRAAGAEAQARLAELGNVELFDGAEAVRARVLRADDVPGLAVVDGRLALIFEGNEGENAAALAGVIAQAAAGQPQAAFTLTEGEAGRSVLNEFTAVVFVMISVLLGALVMAFALIEDKETRAVRALAVSPLSMFELTAARGLFAVLLSLALTFGSAFILLGGRVQAGPLLAACLFSLALPVLLGYIVGGLADSQLKAIAILKFLMLVYLTLPAVAFFLPRSWHAPFYVLPNYWMWQTFEAVLAPGRGGPGLWAAGAITLASSLALVALLLPVLRRQLKLR